MKVLILGGDGMLGHQLLRSLGSRHDIFVTLHQPKSAYQGIELFTETSSYFGIDVLYQEQLLEVMADCRPEVVINCVGLVKQRKESEIRLPSVEVNALFPHRLAVICQLAGARMIHMSTDCVFSGSKGMYCEGDKSDADDLYGRTKYLGEVHDSHCITLRTSIIGLELSRKASLIEWLLAQKGMVNGYRHAIYSGLTTLEMARVIDLIMTKSPSLHGVWHVASNPISKFHLIKNLVGHLGVESIEISPFDDFVADRSLDGSNFNTATGYQPPSWDVMLQELANQIRERNV